MCAQERVVFAERLCPGPKPTRSIKLEPFFCYSGRKKITGKNLERDQARVRGPSHWVKEDRGAGRGEEKRQNHFLSIKLSEDIASYSALMMFINPGLWRHGVSKGSSFK